LTSGTIGISIKASTAYETETPSVTETSKLVFLTRNLVMPCGQNQF